MIIRDIDGHKLRLTKTTLTEVTGELVPGAKWSVKLVDLREVPTLGEHLFRRANARDYNYDHKRLVQAMHVGYAAHIPSKRRIGCRKFDKETYAVIKKAIKEAK